MLPRFLDDAVAMDDACCYGDAPKHVGREGSEESEARIGLQGTNIAHHVKVAEMLQEAWAHTHARTHTHTYTCTHTRTHTSGRAGLRQTDSLALEVDVVSCRVICWLVCWFLPPACRGLTHRGSVPRSAVRQISRTFQLLPSVLLRCGILSALRRLDPAGPDLNMHRSTFVFKLLFLFLFNKVLYVVCVGEHKETWMFVGFVSCCVSSYAPSHGSQKWNQEEREYV